MKQEDADVAAGGGASDPFAGFKTGPPRENISAFLTSLDEGGAVYPIDGKEAKKAVEVVTAIYEAARTGQTVKIG